jgi:mono/diheme cytochrome c family protein
VRRIFSRGHRYSLQKEDYFMKKIPVRAAVCIFLMTVMWAGLSTGSEEDTGKDLYNSKCQICHGVKGDGKGSAATYLNTQPADFTSPKFWDTHNDKQISDAIENGRGEMPAFDLKPGEIKAITDYITHTFKPEKK